MITEYFAKFDEIINQADFIISSEVQKRKINSFLGIIEAKLVFESGLLEILEVVKETDKLLKKKKYKYHYQRKNNSLLFRYDNAAHHFEIDTFPHHKHLPDKIISSKEPDLFQVLSEIKEIIQKNA